MKRILIALGLSSLVLVGCGSSDTTSGAAESAAAMAKKSEGAQPLSARDQEVLSRASGPGGATTMKKGSQ